MHQISLRYLVFLVVTICMTTCIEVTHSQSRMTSKDSIIAAYETQLAEKGILAQQELSNLDQIIRNETDAAEKKRLKDSLNRTVQHYKISGIYLYTIDQIWYSQVMPAHIAGVFSKIMSDLEKEYAKLKQLDCDNPVLRPSGELIDPARIPARLLICDRILRKGKGALRTQNTSPERLLQIKSETEDLRYQYLFLLYFGTREKPSTDAKTNRIKGEFWNPMYEFTRKYPNNVSTAEILQFIQMLEANNYRLSPEIRENLMRVRSVQ